MPPIRISLSPGCRKNLVWICQSLQNIIFGMILSITSLKLKNPFFILIVPYFSLKALIQLRRASKCVKYKTYGLGLTSYTMTLWKNEKDLNEYFCNGAHAVAMKKAVKYAREIRVIRVKKNELVSWEEAISFLKNAKVVTSNN